MAFIRVIGEIRGYVLVAARPRRVFRRSCIVPLQRADGICPRFRTTDVGMRDAARL